MGQPEPADPGATVRARARAAIAAGDQPGALILLRVLLEEGPEAAAALSPVVADALVATARSDFDARDRAARLIYQQVRAARVEICQLLECAPLDLDDLAQIRAVLNDREHLLRAQSDERLRDQAIMSGVRASPPAPFGAWWCGLSAGSAPVRGAVHRGPAQGLIDRFRAHAHPWIVGIVQR
jgi:hypothetical protein